MSGMTASWNELYISVSQRWCPK